MPLAFLSSPSVAVDRTAVSASRDVEKAWEDCLRAVARERREVVRAAWVVVSDSRMGATVDEGSEGRAVVVLEGDIVEEGWWRLRRVELVEVLLCWFEVAGGVGEVGGGSPYSARRSSVPSSE